MDSYDATVDHLAFLRKSVNGAHAVEKEKHRRRKPEQREALGAAKDSPRVALVAGHKIEKRQAKRQGGRHADAEG